MKLFNLEQQLKATGFAIKNELIDLLWGFKFVTKLVQEFKNVESDDESESDHIVHISKYNPLAGSSYIKLRKELDHPKKA